MSIQSAFLATSAVGQRSRNCQTRGQATFPVENKRKETNNNQLYEKFKIHFTISFV
jgi:hypothetical protein